MFGEYVAFPIIGPEAHWAVTTIAVLGEVVLMVPVTE